MRERLTGPKPRAVGLALALCLALLCLAPAGAAASRALLSEKALDLKKAPGEVLEGPCGVAFSPEGDTYVSAYYPHAVDVFSAAGQFKSSIVSAVSPEGPCQLAFSSAGVLYANRWHEGVSRVLPSALVFDEGESTGVAVDSSSGIVYVDDRTHVAAYEPSGAPVTSGGEPLLIGDGFLGDAYGLATFGGRIYVADAASETVKVFEASGIPDAPIDEIDGSATPKGAFVSLVDAALAVDPTNGHLLVMDNLQPGFVRPQGAIYEFSSSGGFLGKLPGAPIDGGPSGLAVKESGNLFATSGNSEEGNVFSYGPYTESFAPLAAPSDPGSSVAAESATSSAPGGPAAAGSMSAPVAGASETIQRGRFRVGVDASLAPKKLPRKGTAPVHFSLSAKISATKGAVPPQLQRIEVEINRYGHIEPKGLPVCEVDQIQPATSQAALAACGPSLVGSGRFSAKVLISQQAPFPSNGKVDAFNGTYKGRPAILAHVYGTKPIPTSATIPFVIGRSHGTYGTRLTASLPQVTSQWGYVTGISMSLGKSFRAHGERRSYLSAGCPAPKGFPGATFPLSRTSFAFAGGRKVKSVLSRSCRAR